MEFLGKSSPLDQLGVKYNTNKSSDWTRPSDAKRIQTNDSLLAHYEIFIQDIRRKKALRILELGAGPDDNIGASVRVWKEYFPKDAEIHVADIKPSARGLEKEGFKVHVGDLGALSFLRSLIAQKWDFVLDDASHIWQHQIMAFRTLFPSVVSGGIFVVEDLCTSFGDFRDDYSLGLDMKDAVQYFLALARGASGGRPAASEDACLPEIYALTAADLALLPHIRMMTFIRNACIIVKR